MNAISATLAKIGSRKTIAPVLSPAAYAIGREGSGEISRLEAVSPEYARLKAKRAKLLAEQVEIATQSAKVSNGIRGHRENIIRRLPTAQETRVAELLEDPRPAPSRDSAALDSLEVLEARHLDLNVALAALDRRIAAARMAASAMVRDQVEPEYRALVSAICEQLIALHGAVERYEAFTDSLNADEVAWSSLVGMPLQFANGRDRYSPVAQYLREAAKHGFISANKVPEAIR
ncbi:hypothetical protein EDC40_10358 [Aminobacter aminovorans]|uniref:Uncharacterized protein n=1 Tax=Aminobacter aminovorans TaxID=83263 RepID=A0A380WP94_AMIAI|nr:hypothetical protein [Aminobacter aminovorans]TCS27593.1 hypothetical protein EDC40_10358 [Aminobacter aminovorans]SUU89994.1 Uncharacterised protein [Aminobacter aminovorans]